MKKKSTDHSWETGMVERTSGYTTNTKPGPEAQLRHHSTRENIDRKQRWLDEGVGQAGLTARGDVVDREVVRVSHETDGGEDDKAGQDAGKGVDGRHQQGVPGLETEALLSSWGLRPLTMIQRGGHLGNSMRT